MKINSFQLFLTFALLFSFSTAFAQKQITVYDADDKEVMPFVKIFPSNGTPFFTNINGSATIPVEVVEFKLHYAGYIDTLIQVENLTSEEVFLKSIPTSIDEVVILPGENPAIRIIDKVIANRKKNHPLENDAFTYDCYSKFIFDIDSSLQSVAAVMQTDTNEMLKIIKTQHLFMLESVSQRKFIPPARDREDIIAYKASGLNNPILSTFAQSIQSFHFYDNQFDLIGTKYFNPIALGGTKRYYFLLQDTTVIGNDTTFMISFRPRPDANIEGLKGMLFINTNGYAIERVIAEPASGEQNGNTIKIIQEYKFIDNKKWFPVDLKTKVEMRNAQLKIGDQTGFLVGSGNTYIKNIVLNPTDLKKSGFNNVAISTDKDAGKKTEEEWVQLRKDSLSVRESRTYEMLDSLSKKENFDRKINGLLALTSGKIPLGYFNLPLDKIIDFNYHEGYRLGLGLETSERLMKNIVLGGYFAYGTRDKDWKYGGFSTFHLYKRLGLSLDLSYRQDVINRGSNRMTRTNWDIMSPSLFTDFYQKFMDRQRIAEVKFTIAPLGNLTMHLSANYQRNEFTRNYRFTFENGAEIDKLEVAETAFELKWNIRQRIIILGDIRLAQPTNFPKIQLKITKGWSGIANSSADYVRLFLGFNEDLESLRFGKLNIHGQASQTFGDVPLLFKQYTVGTRQDWNVVTIDALETVFPGEFYHDRQASFIVRYSFPAIKTAKKWFAPEFILHHGLGYGDMANKAQHNMQFWTMDKGVFEGGLVLSGILKIQFMKIGLAAFYRYGYYSDTNALKNIVPKISIRFSGFKR